MRALLRRVPDGFQATLNALAARPDREQVMGELARGMGKEVLPLVRAAALAPQEELACAAIRVLPLFGTRAAGDALVEAYRASPEGERGRLAVQAAGALQARGIHVELAELEAPRTEAPRYALRETAVSSPDGVGSRSVAARLQDQYGVWHAILILWNDQAGVKDGFMRPMSRHEWLERAQKLDDRGTTHVACPPDFARWQVERARRLNTETGFPLEDHLKEWDELIGPLPEGYEPPDPTRPVREAPEEQRQQWIAEVSQLLRSPEIQLWFLEAADCVSWARRWAGLQSRIRLRGRDEALVQEVEDLVREAAVELWKPELAALYRERLLDVARIAEWRRREAVARRAAAVVVQLDESVPPAEHRFFLALTERSLRAAIVLLEEGEDLERMRYRPMRRYQ
jgi:hypothetical protein